MNARPDRLVEDYKGSPLMLCGVEGCPRVAAEGYEEMCGLAKLGLPAEFGGTTIDGPCGAVATVELWFDRGLLS